MNLSDILGPDAVRAPLRATGKKALFQRLAELAASVHGSRPRRSIRRFFVARSSALPGWDAAWRSRTHGFQS